MESMLVRMPVNVKAKVTEGLLQDLSAKVVQLIKKLVKSVTSWAISYDRKLDKLKRQLAA